MRTRRSPRNQQILWKALTPPVDKPVLLPHIPRCWDCSSYPPSGRVRGHCALKGDMVNGRSENRPCFLPR